ncbi:MAG: nucleoside phosphorylase [Candidatus Thorarchaeota archaeon]
MKNSYPILEFDNDKDAIIRPKPIKGNFYSKAILCFFQEVISDLLNQGKLKLIKELSSEMGKHPVYELQYEKDTFIVFHPGIGAPLCGGFFDELVVSFGIKHAIMCGGAGVLDKSLGVGNPIIPLAAIRDEGTSYHYIPPSREVLPSIKAVNSIRLVFKKHKINYFEGKTWTTDGYYRETKQKIQSRKSEGCITVEMEAAAFFAVGKFHNIDTGQILYAGDDVSGENWDSREWWQKGSIREKIFWLAVESCKILSTTTNG